VDLRLAQTLEHLGRDDEAEAAFRQALAGDSAGGGDAAVRPASPAARTSGEAVTWLAHFADAHQGSVDALMFLADARAACGDLDAAIDGRRARAHPPRALPATRGPPASSRSAWGSSGMTLARPGTPLAAAQPPALMDGERAAHAPTA
jgi:hypothetical protein